MATSTSFATLCVCALSADVVLTGKGKCVETNHCGLRRVRGVLQTLVAVAVSD